MTAGPLPLLFDLDGTLVDSAITIAAALSDLSKSRGGDAIPVERVRRLVSKGAAALVHEALGALAGNSDADVGAFRAILATIPAEPGIVFPGVVAALQSLRGTGHRCAVVTNKPEALARLLLDQLDLARFFPVIVGGDTLAVCKPSPAPLRHALAAIGAPGQAVLMIGDSAVDARAAAAAGLPFLLYEHGYEADGCTSEAVAATFAHFRDLPAAIGKVSRAWRAHSRMTPVEPALAVMTNARDAGLATGPTRGRQTC
jgi:phosphoglycolate phosphatase